MAKHIIRMLMIFLLLVLFYFIFQAYQYIMLTKDLSTLQPNLGITLPEGFTLTIFAEGLGSSLINYPGPNPGPRFMAFYKDTLFVTIPNKGVIVALPDKNKDL